MNLPQAHLARVDREKITDYLLNAAHPDNGGKAEFFYSLGFTKDGWPALAVALQQIAARSPIARTLDSDHGRKYILDGPIVAPSGRTAPVRTVWIVDLGRQEPRLVTAYPRPE